MKAKAAYLKEKDVMPWFMGLAKGLHEIHEQGVAHRNITSKTIFFGEDKSMPKIGHLGEIFKVSEPMHEGSYLEKYDEGLGDQVIILGLNDNTETLVVKRKIDGKHF